MSNVERSSEMCLKLLLGKTVGEFLIKSKINWLENKAMSYGLSTLRKVFGNAPSVNGTIARCHGECFVSMVQSTAFLSFGKLEDLGNSIFPSILQEIFNISSCVKASPQMSWRSTLLQWCNQLWVLQNWRRLKIQSKDMMKFRCESIIPFDNWT